MKFSVILPVYNKANTIVQALDSIYAQTVKDFEIIIVNDGSKDNLLDVLSSYRNPVTLINQENQGVSVARNTGIKAASGDYLCFLDADDMWFSNHLETLVNLKEKYPTIEYFATCHKCSYPDGSVVSCNGKLASHNDDFVVEDLIGFVNQFGGVVNTNSMCINRNILMSEKIFFEPGEKLGEDVDVWYRLALRNSIAISKKETTLYRREYSTATIKTSNPDNWCFARRSNMISGDSSIPKEIRKSYREMCDRYYMAKAREFAYNHDKINARSYIARVKNKSGKRYFISKCIVKLQAVFGLLPQKYRI